MSGARKALKVIAIVMIVLATLQIVLGAMIALGASFVVGQQPATLEGVTVDVGSSLQGVGIMAVVSGIISLSWAFWASAARTTPLKRPV